MCVCVYRFPPFTLFTLHWQLLLFTKITFLPFCSCQLLKTHSGTNVRKLIQKGQTKQGDCLKCHNKTLCLIGRRVGGWVGRRRGEEREGNTAESVKPQKCCECAMPFIPLQVQAGCIIKNRCCGRMYAPHSCSQGDY